MTPMLRQVVRYGVVGIASNGLLYVLYLAMTHYGLGHKLAMTVAYVIGVAQTFAFNRRWTFDHQGRLGASFVRYVASYGIGYFVNLLALAALVDHLELPHEWVQGAMILCIAGLVFLLQKYWVFHTQVGSTLEASTD